MSIHVRLNALVLTLLALPNLIQGVSEISFESIIPEDGKLNFTRLAEKYGRRTEFHDVTTEDGYIIRLHRLVGNQSQPVLMWHGILDSSDTFILRGLKSTAVVLNEAGYDVWLGNSRGNKYSRHHNTLDPDKDKQFWDFSFHEMGYYDLPAAIDFVLESTGHRNLKAIGHSQGTTIFYVLGSTRPEYNAKVELLISMAPIAQLDHLKHLPKVLPGLWPPVSTVLELSGVEELFHERSAVSELMKLICSQGDVAYEFCFKNLVIPVIGDDVTLEPDFFRVVIGHFPSGTSRKDFDHFAQVAMRKRFGQFDYGPVKNVLKYGGLSPPDYSLEKVVMPVALMCGKTDNLATVEDVMLLKSQLPNVVYHSVMKPDEFNHIDFNLGKYVDIHVNPLLKELLKSY